VLDRATCAQRSWLELTEAQQGSLSGGIGWQGLEMTVGNRAPGLLCCTSVSKDRANPIVAESRTLIERLQEMHFRPG